LKVYFYEAVDLYNDSNYKYLYNLVVRYHPIKKALWIMYQLI